MVPFYARKLILHITPNASNEVCNVTMCYYYSRMAFTSRNTALYISYIILCTGEAK